MPVPSDDPPVAPAYHLIVVPAEPVAPKSAVPVPHRKPGVVVTIALENPIDAGLV